MCVFVSDEGDDDNDDDDKKENKTKSYCVDKTGVLV